MARRKWTAKQRQGFRYTYAHDLRHALRCCKAGRLPREHAAYLAQILRGDRLPQPKEVAQQIQLTAAQRERNKLWTIPPIDRTPAQLADDKRERERQRKMLARRKAGKPPRDDYLADVAGDKPWLDEGISRATWYRRQMRQGASDPPQACETGCVRV